MSTGIKITRIGLDSTPTPKKAGRKSMKTFPRSAMKGTRKRGGAPEIKRIADPTSPPPLRSDRKSTLRILTPSGSQNRLKTIKQKIGEMTPASRREVLAKKGVAVGKNTPDSIVQQILEGGMEAGMIVVK